MPILGTQQVTAKIAPSSTADTYPTHEDIYALGGFRVVADNTERDAITADRKKQGMLVLVLSSSITYTLEADLTTWTAWNNGITPSDFMLKSVYDPNDDGIVVDSDQLNSQAPSYYLDRTNHTGTQAQSTITNLTADLAGKEDTSDKGIANGYASLDGSGLVPVSQLPYSSLAYKGAWDANTNTPTITSSVGTLGDFYWITVAGTTTIDGISSWSAGEAIVFNGSVWEKALIASGVSSWNSLTGAVSATTANLPVSTDKNYVTDNEDAALNAANSPSASNPIATIDDITSAIVTGVGRFGPETFADGQTLGTGTLRTLTSLGYTNGSAATTWPKVNSNYTIDVTTMDIDWIAWQECLLTIGDSRQDNIEAAGARCYTPYATLSIPQRQVYSNYSEIFTIDLGASLYKNTTGTSFAIFERMPPNQATAAGAMLNMRLNIRNGTIEGNSSSDADDVCMRIGAISSGEFSGLKLRNCNIGLDAQFCLQTRFVSIDVNNFRTYGLAIRDGQWSGANLNISTSNNPFLENIHLYHGSFSAFAGIYCQGNGNIIARSLTFEGGGTPQHLWYWTAYNAGQTAYVTGVKNSFDVDTVWIESTIASRAAFRAVAPGYTFAKLSRWFDLSVSQPVIYECDGGPLHAGGNWNKIYDCPAHGSAKFRTVGTGSGKDNYFMVDDVKLVNDSSLVDAANWDLTGGGVAPLASRTRYEPRLF